MTLPARENIHSSNHGDEGIRARLTNTSVLIFLVVASLNQLTHGPLNVFFTLYVQDHGYSPFQAGQLWALGVLAEVVLFFVLPRFILRLDLRVLLTVSLATTITHLRLRLSLHTGGSGGPARAGADG